MKATILFAILYLILAPFTIAEDKIAITDAWVREVPPGSSVSAAYLTIKNTGSEADKLNAISSDAAENVEIHRSSVDGQGVAKMEMIKVLELPAGEKVELKPGGMHLMLIGLKESLVGKDKITLILDFDESDNVSIEVPVKSSKDSGEVHHHH